MIGDKTYQKDALVPPRPHYTDLCCACKAGICVSRLGIFKGKCFLTTTAEFKGKYILTTTAEAAKDYGRWKNKYIIKSLLIINKQLIFS